MISLQNLMNLDIFGNTLMQYAFALAVFLGALLLLRIAGGLLLRRFKDYAAKYPTAFKQFILKVFEENIFPLLYLGAFYFAASQLALNPTFDKLLRSVVLIALTVQGLRLSLSVLTSFLLQTALKRDGQGAGSSAVSKSLLTMIKGIVWGVGVLFLLDNLGFNVAAIVAGLGIGGIAVALACQTILGDLFNYFVIFFDKPFREGDFIVSGDFMGTIEDIGVKSTRIRALSGEEIVISNSNLTASRIRNYKRMNHRRVEFAFKLSHAVTQEQLRAIPARVRSIIEAIPNTRFDRSHFKNVEEAGLVIETVYFVLDADFNKYMDIQQQINLEIRSCLIEEGVEYASFYPGVPAQPALRKRLARNEKNPAEPAP